MAIVYANSLSGPFILDDQATVVQNARLRSPSLATRLSPPPDSPVAGRPLPNATFALNYAIGGLDVRGYHAVNLALHALCAILVLVVAGRMLPPLLAFAAALLWGVHPLNSEVVNYVSQRTEAIMAACYLLTVYAAQRAADAPRRGRWEALALAACAAGMASKEAMVTAPVIVALYDRVFLYGSWRGAWAARRRLYTGLASTWILLAVLNAGGPRSAVAGFSSGVSPWTYLLNQAEMITRYLRLAVWPDSLVVFYGWPRAIGVADVAPEFAFVAALGVATLAALWRWPAVGFLGAWFFITLAPSSSIVPVATEVGAERRMYLPLMALAVLAALAIHRLAGQNGRRTLYLAVAASAVLAVLTIERNSEYASTVTLARTVVERWPTPIGHHILAEQLLLARQPDEAAVHLRAAVAGGNSRAAYTLGRLLFERGERAGAIRQLQAFVATSELPYRLVPRWLEPTAPEVASARLLIGQAYALEGNWSEAAVEGERILRLAPSHAGAHGLLGDAAFAQEQWSRAAEHYRVFLQQQPASVPALINYGITQVAAENYDEAIDSFTRATRVDPANARARQLLAFAQQDRAAAAAER